MKAIVLTDLQNDFLPGGALAVPGGDALISLANLLSSRFPITVATQDWHPPDHGSFAANHPGRRVGEVVDLNGLPQVLWPVHCVRHTHGAAFAPGLSLDHVDRVFRKGTDPSVDSYSGFYDNGRRHSTGMGEYLNERNVREVYLMGLATDYCVKFSALDAVTAGFKTYLIEDACRGVNLKRGDVAAAVESMVAAGVVVTTSAAIRG